MADDLGQRFVRQADRLHLRRGDRDRSPRMLHSGRHPREFYADLWEHHPGRQGLARRARQPAQGRHRVRRRDDDHAGPRSSTARSATSSRSSKMSASASRPRPSSRERNHAPGDGPPDRPDITRELDLDVLLEADRRSTRRGCCRLTAPILRLWDEEPAAADRPRRDRQRLGVVAACRWHLARACPGTVALERRGIIRHNFPSPISCGRTQGVAHNPSEVVSGSRSSSRISLIGTISSPARVVRRAVYRGRSGAAGAACGSGGHRHRERPPLRPRARHQSGSLRTPPAAPRSSPSRRRRRTAPSRCSSPA